MCKEDARGYLAWGVSKKNYLGGVRNHMCGGGGVKKWHKFSKGWMNFLVYCIESYLLDLNLLVLILFSFNFYHIQLHQFFLLIIKFIKIEAIIRRVFEVTVVVAEECILEASCLTTSFSAELLVESL